MKARELVVLGVIAGVLPVAAGAQTRAGVGRVPGITISQPPAAPAGPSGPGQGRPGPGGPGRPGMGRPGPGGRFFPAPPPPSHQLPVPFAGTIPDPFIRSQAADPSIPFIRPRTPDDVFRATRRTYAPRYGRLSALTGGFYGGFYGGYGGYVDPNYYPYAGVVPSDTVPLRDGRLSLFVTPLSSQVLVDGYYAGTVADFQDRGLWLEPGPRRIELRADGYETVTFDVRINEDETVNYRRELTRQTVQPEPSRPPAKPKTFYVIPGCYAGDSRPNADRLPTGCSSKNLKTIPPVVSRLIPPAGPADPKNRTRPTPQ
jgi:hypothetical protein